MTDDTSQYHSQFKDEVKSVVVGEGNIIYNYYYSQDIKPAPDQVGEADVSLPCPYRGLFHFGPGDAAYFFGRETFVETLVQAVQSHGFVPLLGASGSGKSSVVLAGLVPKLQQAGHWQFTHFRPGADPFYGLAMALVPLYAAKLNETERIAQTRQLATYLRQGEVNLSDVFSQIQHNFPNDRVLLIADQFEELYTLCSEEAARQSFLNQLIAGFPKSDDLTSGGGMTRSARLVLTMRADFLSNALSYRPFADLLQNADLKLGPMNREELTDVIVRPAETLGVVFEAGLVERILSDVEAEPGNLPLLEFALTELWQRRQGKQLTHGAYTDIGEVQGALARHADASYRRLSPAEQQQMRRMFIQLVRPGEGAEDTRRLATKAELGEVSWSLVKQLADDRLVVTSRSEAAHVETVEVVHEALIRNWGELRGWMTADRTFRVWQDRVRGAMQQWQETQKDEGSLLRGVALAEAEEKLKERPDDLSEAERDFIRQSLQATERQDQETAARRRREIRTAWGIAVGSLVGVVISSGSGWIAWNQTNEAKLNQANSLGRYSQSLLSEGKDLDAFVQAIRAGKIVHKHRTSDPEVMHALQKALSQRREPNRFVGHQDLVYSVAVTPDGKTLVSGGGDKMIRIWNLEKEDEPRILTEHESPVTSVAVTPDGKTLVSGSDDNTIRVWNLEKGGASRILPGHESAVNSVAITPDGKTVVSGSKDRTIRVWNLEKGGASRILTGHKSSVNSVAITPDGKTVVSGSKDRTIRVWNLEKEGEPRILTGHKSAVTSIAITPDGKTLVSGSRDGTIRVWNLEKGGRPPILTGHKDPVFSVAITPDGKTVVSGSYDKTIRVWNLEKGGESRILTGHEGAVYSVAITPDGKTVVSDSDDKTIRVWNLEKRGEPRILTGHEGAVYSVAITPDGKTVASGSYDETIRVWNLEKGGESRILTGHESSVTSVAIAPDGKTVVSGSDDGTIRVWNLKKGGESRTLTGHKDPVFSVAITPDGKTVVSGSYDQTIRVWNLEKGGESRTLTGHESSVYSVAITPDGKTVVSGSWDNTIRVWNLEKGGESRILTEHESSVTSVAITPDGKTVVSGSFDKTIRVWSFDLEFLLERSCDWLREYLENPSSGVEEEDRRLCSGIGGQK